MKLSKHDKNLISMSWLAEVLLQAIAVTNLDKVPEEKKPEYEKLLSNYIDAFDIINKVNADFHEEILSVLGNEFMDTLSDLTVMVSLLYSTTEPKKLLDELRLLTKGRYVNEHIKQFIKSIEAKEAKEALDNPQAD